MKIRSISDFEPERSSTQNNDAVGGTQPAAVIAITMSVRDAAKISGLSRSFLYVEMGAGRLQFIKRGGRRLIRLDVLDAYLRGAK